MDQLGPARGIAVSVVVGLAGWFAIVVLVLLITWIFRDASTTRA
jgi:hypothetical protein